VIDCLQPQSGNRRLQFVALAAAVEDEQPLLRMGEQVAGV